MVQKKAPGSRDSGGSSSDSAAERRPAAGGRGFVVGNRFWYWLFLLATALGEEAFYASVFPFWFWNVDSAVGRRVTVVWALSMYIGSYPTPSFFPSYSLLYVQWDVFVIKKTQSRQVRVCVSSSAPTF